MKLTRLLILCSAISLGLNTSAFAQHDYDAAGDRVQLLPEDAFANQLCDAIELIHEDYIRELDLKMLLNHTVQGLYKGIKKPVPKQIQTLLKSPKKLSLDKVREILRQARKALGNDKRLAKNKDVNLAMKHLVSKIDSRAKFAPEIIYISPGEWAGIGIQLRRHSTLNCLEIITPEYHSPAFKAGLHGGDLIHKIIYDVDQYGNKLPKPKVVSTANLSANKALRKHLNGKPDLKVRLLIERRDDSKSWHTISVTRGKFRRERVFGLQRDENGKWNYLLDKEQRIVYVRLGQIDKYTASDLHKVLDQLTPNGIHGLILDLRFHPGGLIFTTRDIAELFTAKNPIVTAQRRSMKRKLIIKSENGGKYNWFPMVCLVNGQTISAGEMLAACLQDHNRALIIGERTGGDVSVKNMFDVCGGRLTIPTAAFRRPSGKMLDRGETQGRPENEWGVTPDKGLQLKLRNEKERQQLQRHLEERTFIKRKPQTSTFRDRQLELALKTLRAKMKASHR